MNALRPKELRYFELLNFCIFALGILRYPLEPYNFTRHSPAGVAAAYALIFFLAVWLVLSISRKGSKIAKWIYVVLGVVGTPSTVSMLISDPNRYWSVVSAVQVVATLVCIWLLFAANSRDWFAEKSRKTKVQLANEKRR